jgi:hypothetical protein
MLHFTRAAASTRSLKHGKLNVKPALLGAALHADYQPDGGLPVSASALPIPEGFMVRDVA